ncbi:protein of unknown function DUF185 [Candidatus Magnetoovum chiemensis]|nr:protein of unknown function DUF185 [Candidatus Magnetoovum chiemensis]
MLREILIEKIKKDGPIKFRDFMDMALYYPQEGYYTSPNIEIGKRGDFVTGSHYHPVFGALIGQQIEQMWKILDMPKEFHLIEYGGGMGYLALDILNYLKKTKFIDSLTYVIIERNPNLQEKQEKLLANFKDKLIWHSTIEEMSPVIGCVFSNELIDAFPVHLIELEQNALKEVYVYFSDNKFHEVLYNPTAGLEDYVREYIYEIYNGYRTEINLEAKKWLKEVSDILKWGFIFIIDYGYPAWEYYSPERSKGTLMAYYKHKVSENPYINIGRQDLTSHVNFTALKRWGQAYGFETLGYCTQGAFLVSMGIDEMLNKMVDKEDYPYMAASIKMLIYPHGLGESHRVMVLYRGKKKPLLKGFTLKNKVEKLELKNLYGPL